MCLYVFNDDTVLFLLLIFVNCMILIHVMLVYFKLLSVERHYNCAPPPPPLPHTHIQALKQGVLYKELWTCIYYKECLMIFFSYLEI